MASHHAYDLVAVARTPNQATGPTLAELGPLYGTFTLTEVLDGPDELQVEVLVETLNEDIKVRLRDPLTYPLEVWLYRDGQIIFAGPVVGGTMRDSKLQMMSLGLLHYLRYMVLSTDYSVVATDQLTVVKDLIDSWQDQDYGDFGLVTSTMGTSGVTRDISLPGSTEPQIIYEVVYALGQANNGFDLWVDPSTREVAPFYPERGTDLSSSVFLERGIKSSEVRFSVGPGVVGSEFFGTATGPNSEALLSSASNTTVRSTFGRAGVALSIDLVDDQTLLDDFVTAYANARKTVLFSPGAELLPVAGADWEDFAVGDTVTYTFDAGLGTQTGAYRIAKRSLAVDASGTETIGVEFA